MKNGQDGGLAGGRYGARALGCRVYQARKSRSTSARFSSLASAVSMAAVHRVSPTRKLRGFMGVRATPPNVVRDGLAEQYTRVAERPIGSPYRRSTFDATMVARTTVLHSTNPDSLGGSVGARYDQKGGRLKMTVANTYPQVTL